MLSTWVERYLAVLAVAFAVLLVGALALIGVLFVQLNQARNDLSRVEARMDEPGAGVQGLREQVVMLEPALAPRLDAAISGLQSLRAGPLDLVARVDETIEVEAAALIDYELRIPIETTVPIRENVETTILVRGPLGVDVPVAVTVPIDMQVPVTTEVVVPVNETVPVSASMRLGSVPLQVDIEDTGLAGAVDSLLEILLAVRAALGAFVR